MTKRLETRLSYLESDRPTSDLDGSCKTVMVSLLAKRDALFWPWRLVRSVSTKWKVLPDVFRKQREYLSGETGLAIKADGKGNWKSSHELRQRLLNSGYIIANHSKGQITDCVLSPIGEATARALVGSRVKRFDQVGVVLDRIRSLAESHKCISESLLFGKPLTGQPADWSDWIDAVLPLLTCGIVQAVPDTVGSIYFKLVPGVASPVEPSVPSCDDNLDDSYLKEFDSERLHLENAEPKDPSELFIPLPAGGF